MVSWAIEDVCFPSRSDHCLFSAQGIWKGIGTDRSLPRSCSDFRSSNLQDSAPSSDLFRSRPSVQAAYDCPARSIKGKKKLRWFRSPHDRRSLWSCETRCLARPRLRSRIVPRAWQFFFARERGSAARAGHRSLGRWIPAPHHINGG
jgi:hypothetical protein